MNIKRSPTTGIYYILRYPNGWRLFSFRYDQHPGELGHPDVWERFVVKSLAEPWSRRLRVNPRWLAEELRLCCYGFPRGRVVGVGHRRLVVLWGADHLRFVTKAAVARAFSCPGLRWEIDEHEHCQCDDKEAVRRVLRIEEDWPSVS